MFTELAAATIVDIADRVPFVEAAYRGHGQINRRPGRWSPEWNNVTLIVYRTALHTSGGATFSILWDDEDEPFMHIMDFVPMEKNSQPPISTSTPINWC
jgi:hypothetical protein